MKKSSLNATALRAFIIFLLFIIFVASFGGFYYMQNIFRNEVADLNLNNTDNVSTNDPPKLNSITVSADNYASTITKDLNTYTALISPGMANYDITKPAIDDPLFALNKIRVQPITITIKNPVQYIDLVKFIKAVETNLPKINIKSLNIKRNSGSKELIDVDPIEAEVYIK